MSLKLTTLVLVVFTLQATVNAQNFKRGKYYDKYHNTVEGLLTLSRGNAPVLKYKHDKKDQAILFSPDELKGFTIENDSFAVVDGFRYEWTNGEIHEMKKSIVQVLEVGPISVYRYWATQGNLNYRAYPSFPYKLDGFLLLDSSTNTLITPRKFDDDRLRDQLTSLFANDPTITQKVSSATNLYDHIPTLVKEFNTRQ